jgi:hypothetical protein
MPGHYFKQCGRRPCGGEPTPARLYVCVRCRTQVLICRCCDRGQIYCASGCAREVRSDAQRAAGRRYQASRRGRLTHAARARRWRARRKNVTHQGSPAQPARDGLSVDALSPARRSAAKSLCRVATRSRGQRPEWWRCHWCGCRCPPHVRIGFLPRRWRGRTRGERL